MTILQIGPMPPQVGGMETFMGDLLQSSLANRCKFLVLNISKPRLRAAAGYSYKTGYAVFRRGLWLTLTSYGYSILFFIKFLGFLLGKKFQLVHIHTASYTSFWEKCAYIAVGRLAGKKIILHVHGALFKEFYRQSGRLARLLIRAHLRRCTAIIVLSDSWRAFFGELVDERKLHVVENGISLAPFAAPAEPVWPPSILHLGEVSERKGIYDLINIAFLLKQDNIACFFDIVGPGDLDQVRAIIQQKNLAEMFTLHGRQVGEKKYDYFRRAGCFVLASYGEGFPIALIEALAAGLPVISTTVGGIPDMIRHGENGFLSAPGDWQAMAGHLKAILADEKLRRTISEANRKYAFKRFDIERCAEKIFALYKTILPQN